MPKYYQKNVFFDQFKNYLSFMNLNNINHQFKYQYLIDLDGWGCTYSRLYWILGSGSVCLKLITNLEQWYYRGLEENHHYIPITKNIQSIESVIHGLNQDQERAHTLSKNAKSFASNILFCCPLTMAKGIKRIAKNKI
jgi:hypothetical protein